MSYGDLYIGRKAPTTAAPAPIPQPINQSAIDHYRALNKTSQDASGEGYTQAERQQAREIRQAMDSGQWTVGNVVPHRLMPLVYDGAVPESATEMQASTGSITARLAAKVERDLHASLATDRVHDRRGLTTDRAPAAGPRGRNDIATDHAVLSRASYKLQQIMQGATCLEEPAFDARMAAVNVHEIAERIALKIEAGDLGMLRPAGTQMDTTTYHPGMMTSEVVEHEDGSTSLHLRGKLDKETLDKMRQLLQRPKKPGVGGGPDGEGLTLKATSDDGYCAYDKTGIWFKDSHLDTL